MNWAATCIHVFLVFVIIVLEGIWIENPCLIFGYPFGLPLPPIPSFCHFSKNDWKIHSFCTQGKLVLASFVKAVQKSFSCSFIIISKIDRKFLSEILGNFNLFSTNSCLFLIAHREE